MRITIACPDALRNDANNLAMVLGYGPDDAETYVGLNWQDAERSVHITARNGGFKCLHINASPRLTHCRDKLRLDAGPGVIQQF